MTVAVFNKGKFVDFWLNDLDDKSWIERTIAAKAWLRQDVEVFWYEYPRNGSEILSFDAEKNLQKIRIEEVQIEEQMVKTVVVEQTFNKIPVYLNGAMV
ncbi:MAG: hypothetical protein EBR27_13180 [Betaproteobacteria bacterium]|nr:hypothetical protein [Betaproteobacteria bacterium]